MILIGSAILAFGLFNVHAQSSFTEGGTLGLTLFFDKLFSISPSVSSIVLNLACYAVGFGTLGKKFIIYSAVATGSFSLFYFLFSLIGPLFYEIGKHMLLASVIGALFVGVGVGLCVRAGGAPCGDDALAMSLSKLLKINIRWVYLITDVTVLALSLIYIPIGEIFYSLITVVISGQIIGFIDGFGKPKEKKIKAKKNDN